MTGLTNYTANNELNYVTGQQPQPALPAVWLGLFTGVGTDAGSGFTEVSGNGYARTQVGGSAVTNGTTASGNNTLHFASTPAWIVAGMAIYDVTAPSVVTGLTVLSTTGTTVVMSGNASGAGVGNGDTISFSAFAPSSGTGPSTTTNGAIVTMAPATLAGWGSVIAFGLFDSLAAGNLMVWDFLGIFPWLPFESTNVGSGAGPVFSAKANGYSNNDPIVFTAEYGGTLPTLTAGTITSYTTNFVANVATDSLTVTQTAGGAAITSSTTGSGMLRKILQQSIPSGVTASFAPSSLVITGA